jgi:hypothetical protein
MAKRTSGNMPFTTQKEFSQPCSDLGMTNAVPRSTEFDLKRGEHRHDGGLMSSFENMLCPREQTFTVSKRGNKVTEGKNY